MATNEGNLRKMAENMHQECHDLKLGSANGNFYGIDPPLDSKAGDTLRALLKELQPDLEITVGGRGECLIVFRRPT